MEDRREQVWTQLTDGSTGNAEGRGYAGAYDGVGLHQFGSQLIELIVTEECGAIVVNARE